MSAEQGDGTKSVAIERDLYDKISELAQQAGTGKGQVASAILRLGLPYYKNRWSDFLRLYPELSKAGPPVGYTPTRTSPPLR